MGKRILFVYTNFSTFVKTDFEILSTVYDVQKYQYKPVKGLYLNFLEFMKQFLYLAFTIQKFKAVYIWFADYHSFLPVLFARLFNKESFLVVGGYDVCRIPSLQYGAFSKKIRGFFTVNSMKYSSQNLTVSNFVDRIVKAISPNSKRTLIYNGVRLKNRPEVELKKEQIVLTVGLITTKQTYLRKGIDTFLHIANLLPQYEFVCVGIDLNLIKTLKLQLPKNVLFRDKVEQTQLIDYYKKAKVYAQFSRMDTFCLALAESMIFNCIPVITNIGGMPEVVGNAGYIVKRNPKLIAETISNIIDGDLKPKENGAVRINTLFHKNVRKEKLLEAINNY